MEAKDAKITEQHALFEARFQTIEDQLETLTHNINVSARAPRRDSRAA